MWQESNNPAWTLVLPSLLMCYSVAEELIAQHNTARMNLMHNIYKLSRMNFTVELSVVSIHTGLFEDYKSNMPRDSFLFS